MAVIAGPPSGTIQRRAHHANESPTEEQLALLRARHRRNELIGLIAFCAVLAVVFLMRNYAS
jgi:DNA-binding CsgD family transcriptional regulator